MVDTSTKTIGDLNFQIDKICENYKDINTISCLNKAIGHLEQYKQTQDNDEAYIHFLVATTIVTNTIPQKQDYQDFIRNKSKKEIYDGLVSNIFHDKRIITIKDAIKARPKSEDLLVERFDKLRVRKSHLSPPLRLNYRSRSPSPVRPHIDLEETPNETLFEHFDLERFLGAGELLLLIKEAPKSILLLDIRNRKDFDKSHILFENIVCIEPFTIQSNLTEIELQNSLLISPQIEQRLFEHRDLFELVVLYDYNYQPGDQLPSYFFKLAASINMKSLHKPLKRNPVILNGGLADWLTQFGKSYLSQPRVEELIEPIKIPSRPLSFRKTGDFSGSIIDESPNSSRQMFNDSNGSNQMFNSSNGSYKLINNGSTHLFGTLNHKKSSNDLRRNSNSSGMYFQQPAPLKRNSFVNSLTSPASPMSFGESPVLSSPSLDEVSSPTSISNSSKVQYSGIVLPEPVAVNSSPIVGYSTPPPISKPMPVDFTSGLYNLGNSCYINCVLQCLAGTSQLTYIFLTNSYRRYINVNSKLGSKGVLANNYYEVLKLMSKIGGDSYVVPSKFKNICGSLNSEFKGYEQQDCQEFLNFLLDGLHEDINQCGGNPPMKALSEEDENRRESLPFRIAATIEWERYLKTDFSAIIDLFTGQYLSRLTCMVCGRTSTTYQPFSTLSLPIPKKSNPTIQDCFVEFTKTELLDDDNKWGCPTCKKPQRSTKVLKITRLPKVLILHFKRFKSGFGLAKLETPITYPITSEIKLDKFWTPVSSEDELRKLNQLQIRGQVPPFNYKVYGVINHSGTLKGGHYTSWVYKGLKKGWCYFDDTKVYKQQNSNKVCSKDNYVIFLQRV